MEAATDFTWQQEITAMEDNLVLLACVPIAAGLLLVALGVIITNRYLGRRPNKVLSRSTPDVVGSETVQTGSRQDNKTSDIAAMSASYSEPLLPASQQSSTALSAGTVEVPTLVPSLSSIRKTYETPHTEAHYAVPVPRPIDTGRRPATASASRKHLMQLQDELQSQYYTLSKRIAAIDTDLGLTLDSLSRQVLEEQRDEYWNQREEIAAQMARIEKQLGK